jgi:Secretion system C-terminal sorting domain
MKKIFLLIPLVGLVVFAVTIKNNTAYSHETGGDPGNAGVPTINAGATCGSGSGTTVGCHDNGSTVATIAGLITSNIPASGYVPGTTYTITVSATAPSGFAASVIGFSVTPRNSVGVFKGTLVITNAVATKLNGTSQYATHKIAGIAAVGNAKTYTFNWIAPVSGSGNITFYGVALFGNGDSDPGLDVAAKSTLVVNEDLVAGVNSTANELNNVAVKYFNKQIVLNYILTSNTDIKINVVDMNGKQVLRSVDLENQTGSNEYTIDALGLSKGVYVVNVLINDFLPIAKKINIE